MKSLAALRTLLGESDFTPSVARVFLHLWCVKFLKRAGVLKNQTFFHFISSKCFYIFHIRYFMSLFLACIFFIYTRFENTHEALISQEVWDIVQKNREQRYRPVKSGEPPLFSGLLICADCGHNLASYRVTYNGVVTKKYTCSRYRNLRGVYKCTAHYIREDVLETLVLENLRKVITYARNYEEEFVQQVMDNTLVEQKKQQAAAKRQLEQQTRRISEIDTIIQRLYEDYVSGKLTDERFSKMSAIYEKEQGELGISSSELRKQVETCEQQAVNIKSFLKLVKGYTEPQKLTAEILHMIIEKIVVHDGDWSSGHRIHQVDIYYNFVGQLDMSIETTKTRRRTKEDFLRQSLSRQPSI